MGPNKTSEHLSEGRNIWVVRNGNQCHSLLSDPNVHRNSIRPVLSSGFTFQWSFNYPPLSSFLWGSSVAHLLFSCSPDLSLGGLPPTPFHAPIQNAPDPGGLLTTPSASFFFPTLYNPNHTTVSSHQAHNLSCTLAWKWASYPSPPSLVILSTTCAAITSFSLVLVPEINPKTVMINVQFKK